MHAAGPKNPLHGITLEKMVTDLSNFYGWEMLGRMIKINCFNWQPSVKSSLVFLRKTPWARQKVEELYVDTLPDLKTGKSFDELFSGPQEPEVAAEATADEDLPAVEDGTPVEDALVVESTPPADEISQVEESVETSPDTEPKA